MKILEKGKDRRTLKAAPDEWWVGEKANCRRCGFKGVLEPGDEVEITMQAPDWESGSDCYEAFVSLSCPNCGDRIMLIHRFPLGHTPVGY